MIALPQIEQVYFSLITSWASLWSFFLFSGHLLEVRARRGLLAQPRSGAPVYTRYWAGRPFVRVDTGHALDAPARIRTWVLAFGGPCPSLLDDESVKPE